MPIVIGSRLNTSEPKVVERREVRKQNMSTAGKIRIYDLAKELKLDNKKVIEDARREGIDVSVPSNTVPNEVADRIRAKYFPKKAAPKAVPRLIKHVASDAFADAPAAGELSEETPAQAQVAAEAEPATPSAAP